ncbi:Metalloenzyme, LuxS/M16 peptidase-like protein [Vararia minispora EC-137]|uniref:Metalloenzyme, LuxS/M16 peptidase-like protein n=1 Tax=Vararia minispora EC-137 TaxID=1314806 RepID=A0ACB8QM67_9AGAM|nr:Metalloenzyme, LuxS/M16 peptidase-like protein [Vararia minispora EC-137]
MALGAPEDRACWERVSSKSDGYSIYTKPIEKSDSDDREYRLIQLDNKLQVLLVSDPKADKAAASLDVGVGHLHDPDDMPGLAHFCEHLLFMGTEQYPKENEYSEYLNRNSGHSNAFTATTNTNYYFSVAPNALSGALSRFAGFFHSPLFAPSCTTRELNAVDSENKKNQQNDLWRTYQVNKHLSKPGHVWSKFGSGNKESLTRVGKELKEKSRLESHSLRASLLGGSLAPSPISSRAASPAPSISSVGSETDTDGGVVGRETRRRLVEWWSQEYCASRMRLAVIGKDSLDDLATLVTENFSRIANRGRDPLPIIPDNPFGPEEKGTIVSIQTVMAFHCMEISFPLAWQPPLWQFKPSNFLSDLIGNEGPGSLHSYLKGKGWITALVSGQQALARGFAMFRVTLYMTSDGFLHYREIMEAVFSFVSLLKSTPLPLWYQHEMSALSNIRFRFQEKRRPEDYAVWLSETLSSPYPRSLILKAPQVVWPWEADGRGPMEATHILNSLRVDESRTVLLAQKEEHVKVAGEQEWSTEPWYGTQYRVDRYDAAFLKVAESLNTTSVFKLPVPNEFIPQDLSVDRLSAAEPQPRPHLIRNTRLSALWYKKDDRFWNPKTHFILEIRSPEANASPMSSVLNKLFADLVTDSLTEYSYSADVAGLTYYFMPSTLGAFLVITGYNDKLHVLLRHVLDRIRNLQVLSDRLDVMKEQTKREWENFFLGQTYRISDYYTRYLLNERQWTIQEKLEALSSVTVQGVRGHAEKLLSRTRANVLVVGNTREEEAAAMVQIVEECLGAAPLSNPEPVDLSLSLPEGHLLIHKTGSNFVWSMKVPNPNEPNSALTYYLHYGSHTDRRNRVLNALLTQIISEPAFNILRTQEQLGYIVSASTWTAPGANESGLRIVVQSERSPVYLENRVEAFLDYMKTELGEMGEEIFTEQKNGLKMKWLEAPKNLPEETSRYWGHIDSGYLDFFQRSDDSTFLETVTKADIYAHFMSKVHPSSKTRAKVSVHCLSQKPRPGHISLAAAEAFVHEVKNVPVDVDALHWREELMADGEPTTSDFAKFWQKALAGTSPAIAGKLLVAMQTLVQKFPSEKDAEGSLNSDVVHIDNVLAFKESLNVSERPYPLVEWKDLPTAHL